MYNLSCENFDYLDLKIKKTQNIQISTQVKKLIPNKIKNAISFILTINLKIIKLQYICKSIQVSISINIPIKTYLFH